MSQAYPSAYYQMVEKIEGSHFWFQARRKMLTKLISYYFPNPQQVSFFEIGCGTGIGMRLLESLGFTVTGCDVNPRALLYARRNTKAELVKQSVFSYRPNKRYHVVGAFDVMEHQLNDLEFLKHCFRLLENGGRLFLTVPAGRRFWSRIDDLSGHKRRYEPKELLSKVQAAGFKVKYWNYWNVLTLPLFLFDRIVLLKKTNHNLIEEYLKLPPPLLNKTMEFLLDLELPLMFRMRYFIGATLILCAVKHKQ